MYQFFNRLGSRITAEISGAYPECFLNACAKQGIDLLSVQKPDSFTLRVELATGNEAKLENLAAKNGCTARVLRRGGGQSYRRTLLRRLVPAATMLLLLSLMFWSRLYIWEIEVTGNETVETGEILAALGSCGVEYGSFWPSITSDNIRSQLLTQLPELSWATVNIYGSRAEVVVRERVAKPDIVSESQPADLVANKTGAVVDVQALIGTALVRKGSAVSEGDILISGGVESTFSPPRLLHAWGTVSAQTYYELSAAMPLEKRTKCYTGETRSRWSLSVGNERVNFFRNSSIYDASCDKIKTVWNLGLKGLFAFPVYLERESCRFYETELQPVDQNLARRELEQLLRERLRERIGENGEILSEVCSAAGDGDTLNVCLRAVCAEEIGVTVPMSEARVAEIRNNFLTKGEETDDGTHYRGGQN